jgi:hypothetical protein
MLTTHFDRRVPGRSVHPPSAMNATTARALIAHLATTLVLGVVVLLAAWQFMFNAAVPQLGAASSHRSSVSEH